MTDEPRKWAVTMPVADDMPDEMLPTLEQVLAARCVEQVREQGYTPVGEPTVQMHESLITEWEDPDTGEMTPAPRRLLAASVFCNIPADPGAQHDR